MPDNQEVEIKMRANPEEVGTLTSLDFLRDVKPQQTHFRTDYFDDRKHDLARHGFELHVRSDGIRRVQTLKSLGSVVRGEWETAISQVTPAIEEIKKTPAGKFIKSNSNQYFPSRLIVARGLSLKVVPPLKLRWMPGQWRREIQANRFMSGAGVKGWRSRIPV